MRKKLIAAAALLAIAAAPAFAELKVYGDVDFGVHYLYLGKQPDGRKVTTTQFAEGGLKESRIGIMAKRDLDNGGGSLGAVLEANFELQGGRVVDSPSNVSVSGVSHHGQGLFTNVAFIFAEGERYGRISMGRQRTPMDDIAEALDPSDGGLGLTNENLLSVVPGYVTRTDNSVRYSTPIFHDVEASFLYSTGDQVINYELPAPGKPVNAGRHASASVSYNRGPLFLGLGYANQYIDDYDVVQNSGSARSRSTLFGLSYDFGVLQPFMSYLQSTLKVKSSTSDSYAKASSCHMYAVGVRVPVGEKGSVVANYGRLKNKIPNTSAGTLLGIGYVYKYNKSTSLYVAATRVLNALGDGKGAGIVINEGSADSPALISATSNPRDFQFGVNISF